MYSFDFLLISYDEVIERRILQQANALFASGFKVALLYRCESRFVIDSLLSHDNLCRIHPSENFSFSSHKSTRKSFLRSLLTFQILKQSFFEHLFIFCTFSTIHSSILRKHS